MRKLERLAWQHSDCEVIALTGDCVKKAAYQLPAEWSNWPQPVKLSVPGNHGDHTHAYDLLTSESWLHKTPWTKEVDDVLFVGIGCGDWGEEIATQLKSLEYRNYSAVVWLTHHRVHPTADTQLGDFLRKSALGRKLLLLHGHKHAFEWDDPSGFPGKAYWRSCVYSGSGNGAGHRITWTGDEFQRDRVEGAED